MKNLRNVRRNVLFTVYKHKKSNSKYGGALHPQNAATIRYFFVILSCWSLSFIYKQKFQNTTGVLFTVYNYTKSKHGGVLHPQNAATIRYSFVNFFVLITVLYIQTKITSVIVTVYKHIYIDPWNIVYVGIQNPFRLYLHRIYSFSFDELFTAT